MANNAKTVVEAIANFHVGVYVVNYTGFLQKVGLAMPAPVEHVVESLIWVPASYLGYRLWCFGIPRVRDALRYFGKMAFKLFSGIGVAVEVGLSSLGDAVDFLDRAVRRIIELPLDWARRLTVYFLKGVGRLSGEASAALENESRDDDSKAVRRSAVDTQAQDNVPASPSGRPSGHSSGRGGEG